MLANALITPRKHCWREPKFKKGCGTVARYGSVVVTERVIVTHQGALLLDAPTREALTDRRVVDVYLGQASEDTDAGS